MLPRRNVTKMERDQDAMLPRWNINKIEYVTKMECY